jgi:hypothetical protein
VSAVLEKVGVGEGLLPEDHPSTQEWINFVVTNTAGSIGSGTVGGAVIIRAALIAGVKAASTVRASEELV